MKNKSFLWLVLALVCLLGACGGGNEADSQSANQEQSEEALANREENTVAENGDAEIAKQNEETQAEQENTVITAELNNGEGQKVGTAELKQVSEGVVIKLEASDLPPGMHGFHIHEIGKCEAPAFESAGGHFNPTNASHGMEHENGPHAGDLPNLEVGEDGKVQAEVIAKDVTLLSGKENSLVGPKGTSLVIHAKADDGISQPAGDAGDRLVCGVIGK